MKNKPKLRRQHSREKLPVFFSLAVFLIMISSMIFIGLITIVLSHLGLLKRVSPLVLLLNFAVVSILIGTGLARMAGSRLLSPIIKISDAAQEIAKGNFSVRLSETSRICEIHSMTISFNHMAQELSNIELMRNDFINNVSHEFKTPLSAIEGYATLLQSPGLSEEKRRLYTSKIIYNTKRLSSLTGNILQLSHLEAKELPLEKTLFSLDEQLREIILMFENQWTHKNLHLDIDLDTVTFYGSSELLSQVWQNLIDNAVKFTDPDGCIRISLRSHSKEVSVTVADDGPGIPEAAKDRIFEKFYQGDPSHGSKGNGLGLALVKKIVALHAGEVSVDSKEGQGCVFTVTLPIQS